MDFDDTISLMLHEYIYRFTAIFECELQHFSTVIKTHAYVLYMCYHVYKATTVLNASLPFSYRIGWHFLLLSWLQFCLASHYQLALDQETNNSLWSEFVQLQAGSQNGSATDWFWFPYDKNSTAF